MGKKTQAAREAARFRRIRKRKREERGAELLSSINEKKPPEILNTALAALRGSPLPNDPWNFNSVLENQEGSEQAEKFISIIRRTRRSTIVKDEDGVHAVWDLCAIPWVRPLGKWSSKGKKAESKFRSLAAHLTCKFPMPQFLFSVFFMRAPNREIRFIRDVNNAFTPNRNRAQMLDLFEYLAGGGSVRKAVKEGKLPVPFTKKMCHEFMQGPANGDVYEAIRYAQVRASGGGERLARELANTRLGRGTFGDNEPRLLTVIEWYCRQGMLNPDVVSPLYDYIEHRMRDLDFAMAGRTVGALTRGMHEWHAQLNARPQGRGRGTMNSWWNRKPPAKFEPSGWEEMMVEVGEKPRQNIWTMDEILTMSGLRSEGAAMHHCVSSYWHRIESGNTSIWSLQCDGLRQLTVEVDNTIGAIVQARGACNLRPTSEQNRLMHHWASKNRLRVRST